ncbi:hypothetical protein, partial [Pseudanabaena sp. 'Roaring Creek']|uniref:hypothetical protein n=1 Tax=Pseudanabaena sp. 'Roaring Creek' TaxID=1681830 RepID=UPI000B04AFAD
MLKIVSQTNSEILISSKDTFTFRGRLSAFIFLICFNLPFLYLGLFPAFHYASKTGVINIECDRVKPKQVNCQISKSKFFDLVKTKPLDYKFVQYSAYDLVETGDTINENPVYRARVLLMTGLGEMEVFEDIHKLTGYTISDSLNSFVGSNQKSFSYKYDERLVFATWWGLIVNPQLPWLLVSSLILWFAFVILIYNEEFFFDKSNRLLKHTKWTLFGTKINHYLFNEIAKIDVLYSSDSYNRVSFIPRITINS